MVIEPAQRADIKDEKRAKPRRAARVCGVRERLLVLEDEVVLAAS